jgi:hypothetical protein
VPTTGMMGWATNLAPVRGKPRVEFVGAQPGELGASAAGRSWFSLRTVPAPRIVWCRAKLQFKAEGRLLRLDDPPLMRTHPER